jgi:uncharacterized protein involved in exopolysaccharide biosynthesis
MNSENLPAAPVKGRDPLPIVQEIGPAFDGDERPAHPGMSVYDILFSFFRHKWKIISFGFAGLVAAGVVYLCIPSDYESQARLLVRYVMDRSAVDSLDSQIETPTSEHQTLLNSEVQILTSSDLIRQVAESVGVDRLGLGTSGHATIDEAVECISHGLEVSVVTDTNIISVAFKSSDPRVPQPVLQELVNRYFDKHLEVHRSTGTFEFVAQQTAEVKKQLAETEAELKQSKESVGIVSLAEAKLSLAAEVGKTQQELDFALADLAAQQARVKNLEEALALTESQRAKNPVQPVSGDLLEKYKSLVARLTQLQKVETELLFRYTPENPIVKVKTAQIEDLEKQRSTLEKAYPALLMASAAVASEGGQSMQSSLISDRAILAGIESRVKALKARTVDLQERVKTISEAAPRIQELERKAEMEETNYKHSEASLEKARIDETLDPSRIPNISIVQTPSAATKAKRNLAKVVLAMAGGGFAVGGAIALLIELILDQTVKRSIELETRLQVPLLLTIPYLKESNHRPRLRDAGDNFRLTDNQNRREVSLANGSGELLTPFCEAIRDRLAAFFEVNKMGYRPKLVAVTSLAKNAGASTIAAGLANALSETSEDKVLLVENPPSPKGFYNKLAEFKQSGLDYIVFDMPSLGDTSSTLPLAGFMDMVLLIVEAGTVNRQAVKRAYAQLASRTNVSVVFNKSRPYAPKWLEGDV